MAHVYFRHPHGGRVGGWHERVDSTLLSKFPVGPSHHVDVIAVLLNTAGVELVVTWLHVAREVVVRHSKGGMAIIAIDRGGALAYQVKGDVDPMHYDACGAAALVGRAPHALQYHSAATWLNRTADCDFPYGVVRLYQLMSTPQGSDVYHDAESDVLRLCEGRREPPPHYGQREEPPRHPPVVFDLGEAHR